MKKEEKKKLAELPKDLSNADAETVKRLRLSGRPRRLRGSLARSFLYKHENGDVVLADGQPSRRSKRGKRRAQTGRGCCCGCCEGRAGAARARPARAIVLRWLCMFQCRCITSGGLTTTEIKHHLSSLIHC